MLVGGRSARMPILRNTPAPQASRSSGAAASFTHTYTVPSGLPTSVQAIVLAVWLQNIAGGYTMKLDGNDAAETIAAGNNADVSTPCAAAFRWANPAAGSRSLVLAQADLRSLVTCMWLFDQIHPTIRFEANYHLEASTSSLTVPISLVTGVPTYGIALAGAQGNDTSPVTINASWTDLGNGKTFPSGAGSVTTDLGYIAAHKALPAAVTAAPTVTFSSSDGRGAIALAIRGA